MQAVTRFTYASIPSTLYDEFCKGTSIQCTEVA